jgi:hypothetical protein
MPNDNRPAHATLPRIIILDGVLYPHLRAAARAAGLTYNRLYEAVRRGRPSIDGHAVAIPPARYRVAALNNEEAGLVPYSGPPRQLRPRKPGEPLLCYPPGEDPLSRGLFRYH